MKEPNGFLLYSFFFLASLCILNKKLDTLIISFQLVKVSNIFLSSIPPRFYYPYISLRQLEYSIYTLSFSLFCLIFQFRLLRVLPDFWERGISTRKYVCLNSHIWTECSVSIPFWFGAFGGHLIVLQDTFWKWNMELCCLALNVSIWWL